MVQMSTATNESVRLAAECIVLRERGLDGTSEYQAHRERMRQLDTLLWQENHPVLAKLSIFPKALCWILSFVPKALRWILSFVNRAWSRPITFWDLIWYYAIYSLMQYLRG